jgi:PTH1 family peptidyl-tRNA hydrolase
VENIAIVGLGNPGELYDNTRHNIGFWIVDQLALSLNLKLAESPTHTSHIAEFQRSGRNIYLVKPMTYMNQSGKVLQKLFSSFGIDNSSCLLVHDELDIELGKAKLSGKKGPGGHNGVVSVFESLGYMPARLRVGMFAERSPETSLSDFVLSSFSADEKKLLHQKLPDFIKYIFNFLDHGLDKAMNLTNHTKSIV